MNTRILIYSNVWVLPIVIFLYNMPCGSDKLKKHTSLLREQKSENNNLCGLVNQILYLWILRRRPFGIQIYLITSFNEI